MTSNNDDKVTDLLRDVYQPWDQQKLLTDDEYAWQEWKRLREVLAPPSEEDLDRWMQQLNAKLKQREEVEGDQPYEFSNQEPPSYGLAASEGDVDAATFAGDGGEQRVVIDLRWPARAATKIGEPALRRADYKAFPYLVRGLQREAAFRLEDGSILQVSRGITSNWNLYLFAQHKATRDEPEAGPVAASVGSYVLSPAEAPSRAQKGPFQWQLQLDALDEDQARELLEAVTSLELPNGLTIRIHVEQGDEWSATMS